MKTLYIILSFCVGLFLGYLIFPGHSLIQSAPTNVAAVTESKLQSIDSNKQAATIKLQLRNNQLAKSLISLNALLADSKENLSTERQKVLELTRQLNCKGDSLVVDSLSDEITSVNLTTDSIVRKYEQKDSITLRMVAVRDSQIVLCNQSYNQVKDLVREQEQREIQLTSDLNTALKENKRIRLRNKLLAGAALFIAGLATTLYIKK